MGHLYMSAYHATFVSTYKTHQHIVWLRHEQRQAFLDCEDIERVLRKWMRGRHDGFQRLVLRRTAAEA
jgi:hypothetical protein